MAHGGARSGSGRKPGGKARKTSEIALQASSEGVTPIQVMLKAMRAADEKGDHDAAARYAHMAAPYCHPRLSSVEVGGSGGGPLRVAMVEEIVDPEDAHRDEDDTSAQSPGGLPAL